ncbi:hypothetical protein Pmani_030725 [Petrolisthes manimaculis]|uniref:Uncharacterized protein n=1 Tax=Petrolisthes manimaculis TaxID=1843537 RepID=A0AAE1NWR5_9EUCA|nr:hypothetical protein Pmani_030725 [Petrolisthes manimaculis]
MTHKPRSRSLDPESLQDSGVRLLRLRLGRRGTTAAAAGGKGGGESRTSTLRWPGSLAYHREASPAPVPAPTAPSAALNLCTAARSLLKPAMDSVSGENSLAGGGGKGGPWVNEEALVREVVSNPYLRRHSFTPPTALRQTTPQLLPCHRRPPFPPQSPPSPPSPPTSGPRPSHPPTAFMVSGQVQNFYSSDEWRAALAAHDRHPRPTKPSPSPASLSPQPARLAPQLPPGCTARRQHTVSESEAGRNRSCSVDVTAMVEKNYDKGEC